MSGKEEYARKFLELTEASLGKEALQQCIQGISKTGEAVWDVDNYNIEPEDEPETKPNHKKEVY